MLRLPMPPRLKTSEYDKTKSINLVKKAEAARYN